MPAWRTMGNDPLMRDGSVIREAGMRVWIIDLSDGARKKPQFRC